MAAPDLTDLPSALERLAALEAEVQQLRSQLLAIQAGGAQDAEAHPPRRLQDGTPTFGGWARGMVLYIADDFDAPLDDFADYM